MHVFAQNKEKRNQTAPAAGCFGKEAPEAQ